MWFALDTWIVLTGTVAGCACAIPGCFLVLRKMSMMGDAISHAVLPGIAIGFLMTGERSSLPMFIAAAFTGLLTALLTEWIQKRSQIDRGASMGVVFTTFFAAGLLLIVMAADHVDLDPSCVLYGAIEMTPLDVAFNFNLAGILMEVPRALIILTGVLLANILLVALLYKEFKLSSFDPAFSESVGINSSILHYLLMIMVAVTTVAAFEAVGSILVIAMLIVPPASAFLLTKRLSRMLMISCLLAAIAAISGHASAIFVPPLFGYDSTTTAGMIAVSSGVLFALILMTTTLERKWRLSRSIKASH